MNPQGKGGRMDKNEWTRTACRIIQLNRSAVEKSARTDKDQWWDKSSRKIVDWSNALMHFYRPLFSCIHQI